MADDEDDKKKSLLDRMLADAGIDPEEYARDEAQGRYVPGKAVTRSPEFKRIVALPRRDWEARDQSQVEAYFMEKLRAPGGTQRLRPVQVAGLWEMHARNGMFASARTGAGKSLLSFLGFMVLSSLKPMLIVPAALRDKTARDINAYRKNWLIPPYIRIVSYELLGREQSVQLLEEYAPDVIIMDECFPYHAKVLTDAGYVPIGDIVEKGVGTKVACYPAGPDYEWKPIVRRMKREPRTDFVRITYLEPQDLNRWSRTYQERSIVCTPEHKIAIFQENAHGVRAFDGYVRARDLTDEHWLLCTGNYCAQVAGVETVELPLQPVYDLEIAEKHNYYVTFGDSSGVLVSNCHKAKNRSAACVKRIARYVDTYPSVKVVAMSGTIAKRSIKDYAHIANWCLRDGSPVPRDFRTLVEWSAALDEAKDNEPSIEAGALVDLCSPEELAEEDRLRGVRKGYRRRLTDTPGVIATQESALGVSLRIDPFIVRDPVISAAAARVKETWERPDGVELMDAMDLWRHLREIGVGFFYRWNPAPPNEWRQARKAWAAFVREILRTNRRGLDSEKMVMNAIDEGHYPGDYLAAWRAVKDQYDPDKNKEAVWLSYAMIDACAKWAHKNHGIIWVKHVEFGKALAARTGLPYYANQGKDAATGRFIDDHPDGMAMIASIDSNATGRNLQRWSTNLVVSWPTTGLLSEQMISRTHRDGQEAEEVTLAVAAAIPEAFMDFDKACNDARRATDMEGQEQRLCYADITIPPSADRAVLWA